MASVTVLPGKAEDVARINQSRQSLQDPFQAAVRSRYHVAALCIVLDGAYGLRPQSPLPNYAPALQLQARMQPGLGEMAGRERKDGRERTSWSR
jgi:hypothetical protein